MEEQVSQDYTKFSMEDAHNRLLRNIYQANMHFQLHFLFISLMISFFRNILIFLYVFITYFGP